MEKTTKVFNDLLKRLKDDYERKINEIKKIQETLVSLRNKDLNNPESNDISVIESILSSDEIEEIEKYLDGNSIRIVFDLAIKLKRFFGTHSDASQIVDLQENLRIIYSNGVELLEKKINALEEENIVIEKRKIVFDKIANKELLNEEELALFDEFIKSGNVPITEDLIDSLIVWGKDIIYARAMEEKVDEVAEAMLNNIPEEEKQKETKKTINDIKNEFEEVINKEASELLTSDKIAFMKNCFEKIKVEDSIYVEEINDIVDTAYDSIMEEPYSDEVFDMIFELAGSKESMSYILLLLFKKAIEGNNISMVDEVINYYNNNTSLSYYSRCSDNYLNVDKISYRLLKTSSLEIGNIRNSYGNMTYDELKNIDIKELKGKDKEGFLKYRISLLRKMIKERLLTKTNDEELDRLYSEIDNLLLELGMKNDSVKVQNNETENSFDKILIEKSQGLYEHGFENYVVFFDLDSFKATYKDLLATHHELDCNFIMTLMKSAVNTDISKLRLRTVTIKINHVDNEFDIRRLKTGDLRLGVKLLDGSMINGHNVYVIINPSFGGLDGRAKQEGLESNVRTWKKYPKRVKELMRILSKENNQNGISEEAKKLLLESIRYFIEINNEQKNELVQENGGENYEQESGKTLG